MSAKTKKYYITLDDNKDSNYCHLYYGYEPPVSRKGIYYGYLSHCDLIASIDKNKFPIKLERGECKQLTIYEKR